MREIKMVLGRGPLFQNVNLRPPKEAIAATATHLCVQKEQNKATKPPI